MGGGNRMSVGEIALPTGMDANAAEVIPPQVTELTLGSMELILPNKPVNINGEPYDITVDEEMLVEAVSKVAKSGTRGYSHHPNEVSLELFSGKSVLSFGKDAQPSLLTGLGVSPPNQPLLTMQSNGRTGVHLTLPGEIVSKEYSNDGIAEVLTQRVNKDLIVALGQNLQAIKKLSAGLRLTGLALSMGAGEGIGIALVDNWHDMLAAGTGGAFAGGAVALLGMYVADKARYGGMPPDKADTTVVKSVRGYKGIDWRLKELSEQYQIISLTAPASAETA